MAYKLRVRPIFPALVTAASPLVVTKTGATYAFTFDSSTFETTLGGLYAQLTNNLSDLAFKYTAKDNISIHGADIASAATVNLETATGDLVDVTGTVTITAITLSEGHERTVRFTGALTLTNGASLVLPGSANITTAAGDFARFRGYAAGVVRCVNYTPATGKGVIGPALGDITGFGTGVATGLAAAVTGSGAPVLANSPALVGTPLAPTAAAGTNTTQIATTAGIVAERAATKTLTNTTIAGASNTLSVRIANDVTGLGTGVATAAAINTNATGGFPTYTAATWTPTITTTGTVGTPAYSVQVGSYEQIGRLVIARFSLALSGWTGSPTGSISIAGLPVASANTASDYGHCTITFYSAAGLAASNFGITGQVNPNTSAIIFYQNGNATSAVITAAQFGTTGSLYGIVMYHV